MRTLLFWTIFVWTMRLAVLYFVFRSDSSTDTVNVTAPTETEAQNDDMTGEEKEAAIKQALLEQPFEEMSAAEKQEQQAEAQALQAGGETVLGGLFVNGAHATTGGVTLLTENGVQKLMFDEAFSSEAGPELHVFLSGSESPETSAELHAVGDADLGKLNSLSGVQVYELPADLDFEPRSVVIYCVPFRVVFGFADLK